MPSHAESVEYVHTPEFEKKITPHVSNEWDRLQTVIVAKTPRPVEWFNDEIENHVHGYWNALDVSAGRLQLGEPGVSTIASDQHKAFVTVLKKQGIQVIEVDVTGERSNYQALFPRDAAGVIGNYAIPATFANTHRQVEVTAVTDRLTNVLPMQGQEVLFEGGDLAMYSPELIFVGVGPRTNEQGVAQLRSAFPKTTFHVVHTKDAVRRFHLDTVMSLLDTRAVLMMPGAVDEETMSLLKKMKIEIIPAEPREWMNCPTNVVVLDTGVVVASVANEVTNRNLRSMGFTVLEVDLSVIVKQGGGPHCLTLPVVRQNWSYGPSCF